MNAKYAFLSSTRFWAIVIGAVSLYLQGKGIIGQPEAVMIATIMAGFTIIRTVDRNVGDTTLIAAGVTPPIPDKPVVPVVPPVVPPIV